MRFLELQLTAFGPFTDRRLDLTGGREGLHVVFGANEAGKSSTLRAIRALLYGIPARSADSFLHPYEEMRIGARLRFGDGSERQVVRRKGRKDTLLAADERTPLDPALLDRCLRGVDEALFSSLFGLDHAALVQGGAELLAQRGDAGQALFAAGLGSRNLRQVLDGLDGEARALFAPQAAKPLINQELAAHREARVRLAALALSGRDWEERRQTLDRQREDSARRLDDLARRKAERNRLQRARRVQPLARERSEIRRGLGDLGEVVPLPADFGSRLRDTREAIRSAAAAAARAATELGDLRQEAAPLAATPPAAAPAVSILDQAETVERLHQGVGSYRQGIADRQRLRRERADHLDDAEQRLHEVRPGLTLAEAETLRPVLATWRRIQELGQRQPELWLADGQRRRDAEAAAQTLAAARQAAAALAAVPETAPLRRAVDAARRAGDLDTAIAAAAEATDRAAAELALTIGRLGLWSGTADQLRALPVPGEETLRRFTRDFDALAGRRQAADERRRAAATELAAVGLRLEEIRRTGGVPTEDDLLAARARRDRGWTLLRRAWLGGESAATAARATEVATTAARAARTAGAAEAAEGVTTTAEAATAEETATAASSTAAWAAGAAAPGATTETAGPGAAPGAATAAAGLGETAAEAGAPMPAEPGPAKRAAEATEPTRAAAADAYERDVNQADDLADRLRREAGRVQDQAQLLARRGRLELDLAAAAAEGDRLAGDQEALAARWRDLWRPAGVEPLPPREMHPDWTARHEQLRARAETADADRRQLESLRAQRAQHRAALLHQLPAPAARSARDGAALEPVLALGEQRLRALEHQAEERDRARSALRAAEAQLAAAQTEEAAARAARAAWQEDWGRAVRGLGLDADALPAEAMQHVEALRQMFSSLGEAAKLERRILGIDKIVEGFRDDVAALTAAVAPSLAGSPPDQAAVQLQAELTDARRLAERRDALDRRIERLEDEARTAAANRRAADDALARLVEEAGCTAAAGLEEAEQRSARVAELRRQLARVERQLLETGDGLSLADLEREAAGLDADALPGLIDQLDQEIDALETRTFELREELGKGEAELRQRTGGDAAAQEAERAQEILARLGEGVGRYVRLRLAAAILRREIERYRVENQDPLLRRAAELFAELTLGGFTGLRADFDDGEQPLLAAVRGDGTGVRVDGMSAGTRDQLYLALRVATLERHLDPAEPLPFIVDDILINFDDDRSAATLRVLAALAARTQVILFTHHARIRDLAASLPPAAEVFVREIA